MGLFDKLFGDNKEPQKPKIEIIEEWDSYMTNVDHKIGSIMVNLGLKKIVPIPGKKNLVWISIQMNDPREDGLSSKEESEKLYEIEDVLVDALTKKFDCIYPGRLTSDNRRNLYFYFDEHTLYDKIISEVMVAYPNYEYDFGIKEDAGWTVYLDFLYPLPSQYQGIMNRRVLINLEKHGDNHDLPRKVDHYVYFNTENDRLNFIDNIKDDGFVIEHTDVKEDGKDYPYSLHLTKIDKVDYNSINKVTVSLLEKAENFNGYYDGWGCPIEK